MFPVQLELELNISPLVKGIEEIKITTHQDGNDNQSLTWIGKVTHLIKNLQDTETIILHALVH